MGEGAVTVEIMLHKSNFLIAWSVQAAHRTLGPFYHAFSIYAKIFSLLCFPCICSGLLVDLLDLCLVSVQIL